jgi:DNA-binding NtrC family response regulator
MERTGPIVRRALLCVLEATLESELREALSDPKLHVQLDVCRDVAECMEKLSTIQPDVVFCTAADGLLPFLKRIDEQAPVIVVSPCPDTREWIDAMEAGAADYCAPPFESWQLRWMLESAARPMAMSAA